MRILFILEYYYPHIGGVEKLFKMLCEELVADGHEVTVLTNRYKRTLPGREVVNGVRIRRLGFYNRYFFTFFSLLHAWFYAGKADVIHTTSFNAALPAYFASRLRNKKIFITFHEAWGKLWFKLPFIGYFSKWLFYHYERYILRLSFMKFIAVSDYTKRCLIEQGVPAERVMRIYNGVDYQTNAVFHHNDPSDFVFTYFGRLGPSKGADILVPAALSFLKENPGAKLKMIIPREENEIFRFVTKTMMNSPVKDQVLFLHELSREDLFREITHSSCVVIPSYSEGFCFAAAETIALGVPLISSAQGALKEVVSGRFLEMQSMEAKSLYSCLNEAKDEKWKTRELKKFEMPDCIDAYRELYNQ
ncbi:MAG: glycosyltransferase family 4 protein [Bacteroidota bacterium]|nr:glycosyltransferase family 4 protein [Bacteroidota bacterium]